MRIAQLMAGAPNGGAELFFERLTVALAGAGQTVLPLIRHDAGRVARLAAAGLFPANFRYGGPLDIFTKPALRRALRDFRAEVAVAWMSRAAQHLPTGPWTTIGRLGGYYPLTYFSSCRHLVGNTRGIVDYLLKHGIPPARAHYLPNFVEDFAATPAASRHQLGVPADAPLLLGLGRLHPVKGFDVLIRAMAALPNACCVIAGEGPERPRLVALIAELGLGRRVFLPGWRNDVGPLLKAADLFVSSSRHEPLGNMILEAFSAARPVLAARAEGPAELIHPDTDGVLVPIDNPGALAAAAATILTDQSVATSLATAGRRRFEREFNQHSVTAAWAGFLQSVVR